jgi:5'-nucleotidase
MSTNRRSFLSQASIIAGLVLLNKPLTSLAVPVNKNHVSKCLSGNAITIYHTNDLNGTTNAVYDDMGGINHVKNLIAKQEVPGLLFDAGNFLGDSKKPDQHKNIIQLMNNMGHLVATPGTQELINGQAYLAGLIPRMKFKLVNCNYKFNSELNNMIAPYAIINGGKFKIGVTGVGGRQNGIVYSNPIESASRTGRILKEKEKCDLVVCLSQLEDEPNGNEPGSRELAKQSEYIDMVIGSHGKLMSGPLILRNKLKNEVVLVHTAPNGLTIGQTIFNFDADKQRNGIEAKYFIPGQSAGETFASSFHKLKARMV